MVSRTLPFIACDTKSVRLGLISPRTRKSDEVPEVLLILEPLQPAQKPVAVTLY